MKSRKEEILALLQKNETGLTAGGGGGKVKN